MTGRSRSHSLRSVKRRLPSAASQRERRYRVSPLEISLAFVDPSPQGEKPPAVKPPSRAGDELVELLESLLQDFPGPFLLAHGDERRYEIGGGPGAEQDRPTFDRGHRPVGVLERGRRVTPQGGDNGRRDLRDVGPIARLAALVLRQLCLGLGEPPGLCLKQRTPSMGRVRQQRRRPPSNDLANLGPQLQRPLWLPPVPDDYRHGAQEMWAPIERVEALELAIGSLNRGQRVIEVPARPVREGDAQSIGRTDQFRVRVRPGGLGQLF